MYYKAVYDSKFVHQNCLMLTEILKAAQLFKSNLDLILE